jgi:hypothetical protein
MSFGKSLDGAIDLQVDNLEVYETSDLQGDTRTENQIVLYNSLNDFSLSASQIIQNYTLNLPPTTGTSGQLLATDGAGNLSWYTISGTPGNVSFVGLSVPAPFTVNGASNASITTTGAFMIEFTSTGTGDVVLSTSPTLTTPILGAATGTSLQLSSLTASSILQTDASKNLVSLSNGADGTVLTMATGVPTWQVPATSGTVTSVEMTVPSFMSISGSPITSSGTLALSASSTGTGNVVLATSPSISGLNLSGDSQFLGNVDIGSGASPGTLDCFGPTNFYNTVTFDAAVVANTDLTVDDNLKCNGNISFGAGLPTPVPCVFSIIGVTTISGSLGLGDDCLITGDIVLTRETTTPFRPINIRQLNGALLTQWLLGYSSSDTRYQLKISSVDLLTFSRLRSDTLTFQGASTQTVMDTNSFGVLDVAGVNYTQFVGFDSTAGRNVSEIYGPVTTSSVDSTSFRLNLATTSAAKLFAGFDTFSSKYVYEIYGTTSQTSIDENSFGILDAAGANYFMFMGLDTTSGNYVFENYGPTSQVTIDPNSFGILDATGVFYDIFIGKDTTAGKYVSEIYGPTTQTSIDSNSFAVLDEPGVNYFLFAGLDSTENRYVYEIYGTTLSSSLKNDSLVFSTAAGVPITTMSLPTPTSFSLTSTVAMTITSGAGAMSLTTGAGAMTLTGGAGGIAITSGAGAMTLTTAAGALTINAGTGGMAINTGAGAFGLTTGAGLMALNAGAGGMSLNAGAGAMTLTTGAGLMALTSGTGGLALSTGGGTMTMTTGGGLMALSTGGGLMTLTTGSGAMAISVGAGGLAVTTGAGALALTTGAGAILITTGAGGLTSNTFVGSTSFTTTVGDIKLTCGSGNAEISSNSGAVFVYGPVGGVNVGTSTQRVGHFQVYTENGATAAGTADVEFITNSVGLNTGPGNFIVNTTGGYRGKVEFQSKNAFSIRSNNSTHSVSLDTTDAATSYTFKFPSGTGTTGQVLTSQGSSAPIWTTVGGGSGTVTSVAMTVPSFMSITGSPITTSGTLALSASSTGTGVVVLATSPTLVTPNIGAATGTSLQLSSLTASSAVATDASKNLISVTNTGAGNNVLATSPTLVTPNIGAATGTSLQLSSLTASSAVATDASKNLISVTNTGAGNNVLATSPTLVTPNIGAATGTSLQLSSLTASSAVATDASKNLISVTNTGAGNNVLATSPTLTTPNIGAATGTSLTTSGLISSETTNNGVNGAIISRNLSNGSSAFSLISVRNDGALDCIWFMNSSTRTTDGGVNTATIRNDAGTLRLQSSSAVGINLTAATILFSASLSGKIPCLVDNGSWLSYVNSASAGDRYGFGQTTGGVLRAFISNSFAGATFSICKPTNNTETGAGTFIDLFTVTNPGVVNISGLTASRLFWADASKNLVSLTAGTTGQVLTSQGSSAPIWTTVGGGSGTVTSVAMTVPSFMSVSGSPITTSGTLAISASSTGTGNVVLATSPTLTTPNIGAATGTSLTTSGLISSETTNNGVNGAIISRNLSNGSSAFSLIQLRNNGVSAFSMFMNSSTRTTDGGVNTTTLRNEAGTLRLQSSSAVGLDLSGSTATFTAPTVNIPNLTASYAVFTDASKNLVSKIGGSNGFYNTSAATAYNNNTWTNVANVTTAWSSGLGLLIWVNQATGFQNQNAEACLVTVSWSAKRTSNGFGQDALRIVARGTIIAEQTAAALDTITITACTFLNQNEAIVCQAWQNSGSNLTFELCRITINRHPY